MITLTRLSGSVFLLNADLIERVDSTPDTVITLVDGKKYVVSESMGQVMDSVVAYRGEIVALGSVLEITHAQAAAAPRPEAKQAPHLAAVAPHPSAALDDAGDAGDTEGSPTSTDRLSTGGTH